MYSWILPIKNEAPSLTPLLGEIASAMKGKDFEIIAVNDASSDQTTRVLRGISQKQKRLKIIHCPTHQGKWAALARGLALARGEIVITLDSDLQDNPREVFKLLSKLNQGYGLVSGMRQPRFDPWYKNILSRFGNWLVGFFGLGHFGDLNSPLKVYERRVLEAVPKTGSLLRFSMIFAKSQGFKVTEVRVNHRPRLYGQSKFGLVKYLRIIFDLILIALLFSGSGHLQKNRHR